MRAEVSLDLHTILKHLAASDQLGVIDHREFNVKEVNQWDCKLKHQAMTGTDNFRLEILLDKVVIIFLVVDFC